MKKLWIYDTAKRISKSKIKYHFVSCDYLDKDIPFDNMPYELYFRNDKRTEYALLRFENRKNNSFRKSLIDDETASICLKSWK